jgi:hypothetical protein
MTNIEKSTQVLREEHRLIERAILAFTGIIKDLDADTALDRRRVWEIVQSFKTYVERWHHAKEDYLVSMIRAHLGSLLSTPSALSTRNTSTSGRSLRTSQNQFMNTWGPSPAPRSRLCVPCAPWLIFIQVTCGRQSTSCFRWQMSSCRRRTNACSLSSST